MTYFEDIEVGETYSSSQITVTEEEIIDFGERFDPQPFHINPEAAKESKFGALVASGWHTVALCHKLSLELLNELEFTSGIGRGVEELKWLKPIYAGDTLRIEYEVVEKSTAKNHPDFGNIKTKITGYNQNEQQVVSLIGDGMLERRSPKQN